MCEHVRWFNPISQDKWRGGRNQEHNDQPYDCNDSSGAEDCTDCDREVESSECDIRLCHKWYYITCVGVHEDYDLISKHQDNWHCDKCNKNCKENAKENGMMEKPM